MKTVITWGRMNPPTIGHEVLVNAVNKQAMLRNADPHIYLSHTADKKKNPIDYATKIRLAQKAFGPIVKRSGAKTIIQVLQFLEKKGYKEVTLVVGSDRKREFDILLKKYNGKDFNFDSVTVTSEGLARDPDADGATGMSASKARDLAYNGDKRGFMDAMPSSLSEAEVTKIYNTIRKVIGKAPVVRKKIAKDKPKAKVNDRDNVLWKGGLFDEELNFDDFILAEEEIDDYIHVITELEDIQYIEERVVDLQQRRKMARTMKRLAPRLKRKKEISRTKMANKGKLSKRSAKAATNLLRTKYAGKNGGKYASLSPAQKMTVDRMIEKKRGMVGKLAKRMLPKIRKAEQERLKNYRSSKNEEKEPEKYEIGTDKLRKKFEKETPGQSINS